MDSRYSDCLCEVGLGRFVIAAPWGMHWTMMTNTGLIYMRARYYDPLLGRFISEDPARDGGNWFAYAGNNPVGNVDPDGREFSSEDLRGWLLAAVGSKFAADKLWNRYLHAGVTEWAHVTEILARGLIHQGREKWATGAAAIQEGNALKAAGMDLLGDAYGIQGSLLSRQGALDFARGISLLTVVRFVQGLDACIVF